MTPQSVCVFHSLADVRSAGFQDLAIETVILFAGTVSSAAAGLKDRVTGLYSGGETGSAANTGEGLSKPGIEYEDAVSFSPFEQHLHPFIL